jgi:hypothetical protein
MKVAKSLLERFFLEHTVAGHAAAGHAGATAPSRVAQLQEP